MTALRIGSLCTGYGGLDMAVTSVLGGDVVWHSDVDPGACALLAHHWPAVPNLGDITAVAWTDAPPINVLAAGFPCQDLSYAGRGAGIKKGTRSGLWYTVAEAIGALRPGLVVLENVRAITTRRPGLDVVLASLADLGFDAVWACVRASDVGAAHQRERWFCLAWPADPEGEGRPGARVSGPTPQRREPAADTNNLGSDRDRSRGERRGEPAAHGGDPAWGAYAAAVDRWARVLGRPAPRPADDQRRLSPVFVEWLMGLPAGHVTDVPGLDRTAQLRLLGNGVIPRQAAYALRLLLDRAETAAA